MSKFTHPSSLLPHAYLLRVLIEAQGKAAKPDMVAVCEARRLIQGKRDAVDSRDGLRKRFQRVAVAIMQNAGVARGYGTVWKHDVVGHAASY